MLQMRKQHKTNESLLQISGNHKSKNGSVLESIRGFDNLRVLIDSQVKIRNHG